MRSLAKLQTSRVKSENVVLKPSPIGPIPPPLAHYLFPRRFTEEVSLALNFRYSCLSLPMQDYRHGPSCPTFKTHFLNLCRSLKVMPSTVDLVVVPACNSGHSRA